MLNSNTNAISAATCPRNRLFLWTGDADADGGGKGGMQRLGTGLQGCVAGTLLSEVVVYAGHYAYVFDVWGVAVAVGYRKLALGCFLYFAKAAFGVFCKFLGYLASVGGGLFYHLRFYIIEAGKLIYGIVLVVAAYKGNTFGNEFSLLGSEGENFFHLSGGNCYYTGYIVPVCSLF